MYYITKLACKKSVFVLLLILSNFSLLMAQNHEVNNDLVRFFKKWRAFEKPPLKNGVPDYSSVAFKDRSSKYRQLREELNKLYVKDMLVEHKVEWYLLWAEYRQFSTIVGKIVK